MKKIIGILVIILMMLQLGVIVSAEPIQIITSNKSQFTISYPSCLFFFTGKSIKQRS
jgi:hypothetical protein